MLLLLLFRAYVPMGFMPSAGFLALAICPEGLPQQMHHLHHGGNHVHDAFEHCPFGSASAAGPVPHLAALPPARAHLDVAAVPGDEVAVTSRNERAHPATGPPFLS